MGNPPRPPFTYSWPPAALIRPGEKLPRAQPHVLLSRKPKATPGFRAQRPPGLERPPGRSRPILARHCEEDAFLECPAWAQQPPEPELGHPPTHPAPERQGPGPPGKRRPSRASGSSTRLRSASRSHVPSAACPGGGRQSAPCTPRAEQVPGPPRGVRSPPTGWGQGPGQRQASFNQPLLLHRAH